MITATVMLGVVTAGLLLSSARLEIEPPQPIAFSHKIHAGENEIPCQYCHVNARRAAVAGIPSLERCMGCHKITALAKPEIVKLKGYWDRKEPVRWSKATKMPDFVSFTHWPHVRAGLECQTCHGPVERMETMQQVEQLAMKDCLSCHRQQKASMDCLTCHW